MIKKVLTILLSVCTFSCQSTNLTTPKSSDNLNKQNYNDKKVVFNSKTFQDNDLGVTYEGNWLRNSPTLENANGVLGSPVDSGSTISYNKSSNIALATDTASGFLTQNYMDLPNPDKSSNWNEVINNDNAKKEHTNNITGTFLNTNGKPQESIINLSGNFTNISNRYMSKNYGSVLYVNGQSNWINRNFGGGSGDGNDLVSSLPFIIENTDIAVKYNSTSTYQNWSNTMSDGWKTKNNINNSSTNYTYNNNLNKNGWIEFNFTGSNVHIFGKKSPAPGWNDLKVTVDKGTPEQIIYSADMSSNIITDGIFKIQGLKVKEHTIRIESESYSKSQSKPTFMFAFDKALIYPSVEYSFEELNVTYQTRVSLNGGNVDVIPDGDISKKVSVSTYSSDPATPSLDLAHFKFDSKNYNNIPNAKHRIVVEANELSGNSDLTFKNMGLFPYFLSKTFTGDKLTLFVPKNVNYGVMNLYIDDIFIKDINLYEDTTEIKFYAEKINLSTSGNHNFRLIAAYDKNILTNKFQTGLEGYVAGLHKATFRFKTLSPGRIVYVGVKGKNMGVMKVTFTPLSGSGSSLTRMIDLYDTYSNSFLRKTYNSGGDFDPNASFNLTTGEYSLDFEPDFSKDTNSKHYYVNIDELFFIPDSGYTSKSDAILCP